MERLLSGLEGPSVLRYLWPLSLCNTFCKWPNRMLSAVPVPPSSCILWDTVVGSDARWQLLRRKYISGTRGTRAEEAFRFLWWMRIFKVAQRYQEDRPGSHLLGKYVCSFSSIRYMGKALCWLSLWEIPERIKYRKKAFPGCWWCHQYAGIPPFFSTSSPSLAWPPLSSLLPRRWTLSFGCTLPTTVDQYLWNCALGLAIQPFHYPS